MPKKSAGLLPFREAGGRLEVLLVHPGGPFWAKKDDGAWSIPKGEFADGEDPLTAARREFAEETGFAPAGELIPLESLRQPSGKLVYAWAMQADLDPAAIKSNTFSREWPPKSGQLREFPEMDRAAWFPVEVAGRKIAPGQAAFLGRLRERLAGRGGSSGCDGDAGRHQRYRQGSLFDEDAEGKGPNR